MPSLSSLFIIVAIISLLVPSFSAQYAPLKKEVLPQGSVAQCNDGSPYVFYIRPRDPTKFVIFMQGGAWCFDEFSCGERWKDQPRLMSSHGYPDEMGGGYGLLSSESSYNPLFFNHTILFLPYCTSDDFSGNFAHSGESSGNSRWSFLGSHVVPNVVDQLYAKYSFHKATRVYLAGSSAGAEAIYPNIARLAERVPKGAEVLGLDDSGWFMDSKPLYRHQCRDAGTCTEQEGLRRGVVFWNSSVDSSCSKAIERWKCLMGYYARPFISQRLFVFQFRFDAAQLGHDGIGGLPWNANVLEYAQNSAANLTKTMGVAGQTTYFLPSCYHHTVFGNKAWLNLTAGGKDLGSALSDFIIRGGGSKDEEHVDSCDTPDCNPSCAGLL